MLFKQFNRSDPEAVFIIGKNTTGSTVSAGAPLYFETDAVTDGNSVSACNGLLEGTALFAGLNDQSLATGSYGLIQAYGYRQSAYLSAASAGCAIGIPFIPVANQLYLTDSTSANANNFNGVVLMETIAAAAGASATLQYNVFIRAL
jgi:hypothetical protein